MVILKEGVTHWLRSRLADLSEAASVPDSFLLMSDGPGSSGGSMHTEGSGAATRAGKPRRAKADTLTANRWQWLKDFWDTPKGKWVTGICIVVAAATPLFLAAVPPVIGKGGPDGSETPAPIQTSPGGAETSRQIRVGDCLLHDGYIEPERREHGATVPSGPAGDLSRLAIVPCNEPHQLEAVPIPDGTWEANCAHFALKDLGGWRWSTRLVGAPIDDRLCALGVRSGAKLETIDWPLAFPDDPILRYGACARRSDGQALQDIPRFFTPCQRGYYIHYRIYAVSEAVAVSSCENIASEMQVRANGHWMRTAAKEDGGAYAIDCVFELA